MAKRKAATDLNHDNWDREEEPEVAGTFLEAPKEIVQERIIRTAKRRLPAGSSASGGSDNSDEPKKLFSGFSGFGSLKSANPSSVSEIAKNSFSFLKKSDTPLKTISIETKEPSESNTQQTYLGKLKGLNEAVLAWIKQHVEANPCCILTPVFKDYDNFLKEIQNEKENASNNLKPSNDSDAVKTTPKIPFTNNLDKDSSQAPEDGKDTSSKTTTPTFSFGIKNNDNKSTPPSFSFGSKDSSEKPSQPLFSYGSMNKNSTPSFGLSSNDKKSELLTSGSMEKKPLFPFGSSSTEKPLLDVKFPSVPPGGSFTFTGINNPPESNNDNNADNGEDEDEPKPEPVKLVTEQDAVFTKRVKVFRKKDDNYTELGIGNLFIKEAPNGWHQAIVRNETSLGNVILNILLSDQQPTKRLGKNNVMIICVPTPQHTGPAVPVLLRVKTSEEADLLLETINKYKKK